MLYYCERCDTFLGREPNTKCPRCGFIKNHYDNDYSDTSIHPTSIPRSDWLLMQSQPPVALVISSHARLRMKQRSINLVSLIQWLKSNQFLTLSMSGNLCEIQLPSKKRLVGELIGSTLTINTVLLSSHNSRLDKNNISKKVIKISNNITLADIEK